MIAARLAGGNLFLPFLWWGKFLVGDFWSTRSNSEHSDFFVGDLGAARSTRSTWIFLRGFVVGGILFFGGGGGCFGL